MDIGKWISRNKAGLLSAIACVGVVVTAVLAGKGAIKAKKTIDEWTEEKHEPLTKFETVQASAPAFIGAAISGAATIGCVVAAQKINSKHIATITASAAMVAKKYDEYLKTNVKINGREAHEKVMQEMTAQDAKKRNLTSETFFTSCSTGSCWDDAEERLFYDTITGTYFRSTLARVIDAEYHMNHHFTSGNDTNVQTWCDFLGIKDKKNENDHRGWLICDDYQWIDFNNSRPVSIGDGMEVIIIEVVFNPIDDYYNFDCSEGWPA